MDNEAPLSKREKQVTELLMQGKSNKQIAVTLGISENTVEFHLRNVYSKLQVHSRAEAILKLGDFMGLDKKKLRESVVESNGKKFYDKTNIFLKESEMRKRLFYYVLAGMLFGITYWIYFSGVGRLFNQLNTNMDPNSEMSGVGLWMELAPILIAILGVWIIPTIVPAVYEFRYSEKVPYSTLAVIVVWISAVFGYYLIYFVLLGFFGLPNMDYLLFFRTHSATFWQDWSTVFNRLILWHFTKWAIVGAVVSGIAGLTISSLYSVWVRKTEKTLPA